jgi:16S rRNA G527 N7-methylase RsmG
MVRKLSLENVSAVHGRFDELEPVPCDAVVAQAVASPAALLPALERWARPGGYILVPGGEQARAGDAAAASSSSIHYRVPLDGPDRTVWIARRAP